jgi:multidrug transporter EmrE-like cation transporter
MYLFWTIMTAVAFTLGGVCMKASAGMTHVGPSVLVYLCFAAGATFQALALRKAELGVAYMFSLGLEAVLVFALGQLLFAESISTWKVLGVASIVFGMVMMHHDSTSTEKAPQAIDPEPMSAASAPDAVQSSKQSQFVQAAAKHEFSFGRYPIAADANCPFRTIESWVDRHEQIRLFNAPPTGPPLRSRLVPDSQVEQPPTRARGSTSSGFFLCRNRFFATS